MTSAGIFADVGARARSACPATPCWASPAASTPAWSTSTCSRCACRRRRPPACWSGSSATTIELLQTRYAFGRPLASYQALKHRIADHKLWLEAALGISTALAQALAAGEVGSARLASAAKAHIGEQSVAIISDCAQLFGGIAMTWEHDLHLYLRRATVNKFLYGSPGPAQGAPVPAARPVIR